jgi:hypothetical protein
MIKPRYRIIWTSGRGEIEIKGADLFWDATNWNYVVHKFTGYSVFRLKSRYYEKFD